VVLGRLDNYGENMAIYSDVMRLIDEADNGTTKSKFTNKQKQEIDYLLHRLVWRKGKRVRGRNQNIWRKDVCGNLLRYDHYTKKYSLYRWEIDHIKPKRHGGSSRLSNLQPLQWRANRKKQASWPRWKCYRPIKSRRIKIW
jgi:hypothetical protein